MRRYLPGFAHLANFRIATRLALIVFVLTLPIAALLFVQYQDQQEATNQANAESDGLDYIASVMPFLREVQLHRGLMERVLSGDENARANMERTATAADAALAGINVSDRRWGSDFRTRELVAFLNAEWPKARDAASSVQDSNARHTFVIQQGVFPLLSTVATESELVLDPDLDTRNVIVALTETLPRMTEALSLMRSHGAGALAARRNLPATEDTKEFLSAQAALAQFESDQLARQLESAMARNPRFETDLRSIVTRSKTSRSVFMDNTNSSLIDASTLSSTEAEGYFLLGDSAIDRSNELLSAAQVALQDDFSARASDAQKDFAVYGGAAIMGIILALGLAVFISSTITRPISHLAEVADRMSLGELDVDIDIEGDNEIGKLAESLRRMQSSLRSAIERLRLRRSAAA